MYLWNDRNCISRTIGAINLRNYRNYISKELQGPCIIGTTMTIDIENYRDYVFQKFERTTIEATTGTMYHKNYRHYLFSETKEAMFVMNFMNYNY